MQKTKFDARKGPADSTADFYSDPWKYSFVHNFKVHYKRGAFQGLANKLDISISSPSAEMPSTHQVMNEFNERMKASIVVSDTKRRYSEASYHVTQVEYKESFAFYDPQTAPRTPPQPTPAFSSPMPVPRMLSENQQLPPPRFCRMCGADVVSGSAFCRQCGAQIV